MLYSLCDMFLAFYRWNSVTTANSQAGGSHGRGGGGSSHLNGSFTLASVAKDAERSRPIVVQYLPHLIVIYLLGVQRSPEEKKQLKFIETFLLVLYNCEAADTTLDPKVLPTKTKVCSHSVFIIFAFSRESTRNLLAIAVFSQKKFSS